MVETFVDCHGQRRQRSPLKHDLSSEDLAYLAGLLDASGYVRWHTNGRTPYLRCRVEVFFGEGEMREGLIARFGGYERKGATSWGWRLYGLDAERLLRETASFRLRKLVNEDGNRPIDAAHPNRRPRRTEVAAT
jgi:hypothetical protein